MRRHAFSVAIAVLVLPLGLLPGGCSEQDPLAPPVVYFGEDICDACAMIISDERFTAAVITAKDGVYSRALFDDIGCLLAYEEDEPDAGIVARYARDCETRAWLAMEQAVYVASPELKTPMAFGVAACADQAAAKKLLARYSGHELDLSELGQRFLAGTLTIVPEEASR